MQIIGNSVFENAEGYERARIPGIVCTDKDTLIAYCELRRSDSDWAVIDIGMKKSSDGGKTWSDREILVSGGKENTVNNPVMITDGESIHFLYCINYRRVYYSKSTDEGISWSKAEDITGQLRADLGDLYVSCFATGPTHGIKLISGRLAVPVWMATNTQNEKSHHPSVIGIAYSDDGGSQWHIGEIFDGLNDPSEFVLSQFDSGKVIANIRHENEEKLRAVGEVINESVLRNVYFSEELPDPVCCAGMCSIGKEILFSNCAHTSFRESLTLRRIDEKENIIESILIDEKAGYSDIAVSVNKKYAFVLYEYEKNLKCCRVLINNSLQN